MKAAPIHTSQPALSRLKFFFALSRTPHGLLDLATPALAALLGYGVFPPFRVTLLGIVTAFAGYTAVYALNDLVDYRVDREKLQQGGFRETDHYLDAVLIRHPMAYGLLGFGEGLLWAVAWGLLAVVGAYLLNPICLAIFLGGCALETIYCLLWRTSHWRILVSGVVKTAGGLAALFAVDPHPSAALVSVLFLWLFFWEIGGQNIPADWTDVEEDQMLQAKTIPVRFGPDRARAVVLSALLLAVGLGAVLFSFSRVAFKVQTATLALGAGLYFLILPAYRLYRTKGKRQAAVLFNQASYYPLSLLVVVTLNLLLTELK
ncbi:MAG: UbiA family prenyltransferase [Deltaproteobacteria bacterium]|nr:UbiA family prenyltransferase [Deltaproteobacteria bacterium]